MRLPDYKLVEQKILFNHYPGPLDQYVRTDGLTW